MYGWRNGFDDGISVVYSYISWKMPAELGLNTGLNNWQETTAEEASSYYQFCGVSPTWNPERSWWRFLKGSKNTEHWQQGGGEENMHASNKPRSMGKSLLSTCMICSTSVQNGSQQTAKEATTVPAILVNSTNLQAREKLKSGKRNPAAEN